MAKQRSPKSRSPKPRPSKSRSSKSRPSKPPLGQHFLRNPDVVNDILDAVPDDGLPILEIGPGQGVLTRDLAEMERPLVAVDIDPNLVRLLRRELPERRDLMVLNQDILDVDPAEALAGVGAAPPYGLVGNLPYAITALEDLDVLDGAEDAVRRFKEAGFLTVVVSNQPDVASGAVTRETVERINDALVDRLAVDAVFVCYDPEADCYKPRPGMFLEAAQRHGIDLSRSYMVGDRWRDVGAGKAAGCFTVFIDCGYAEPLSDAPDATVGSVAGAADMILSLAAKESL